MPAIQDVYSVNVSNRFAMAVDNELEDDNDSDQYTDFDPLDQLRLIEEQQKRDRVSKKKGKTQPTPQENNKSVPAKKEVQFKENKDANVPVKKRTSGSDTKKDDKSKPRKEFTSKEFSSKPAKSGDRAPPGDENRRPKRQNNRVDKPPRESGGEGDQMGRSYEDSSDRPNRRGPMNNDGENRTDRRDRGGSRYERYRGNRGSYRGSSAGSYGYRNNYRNDGRDDRGKREFDRRSGSDKSGVRPSDKRDGGGPRNWGTPGNEIEETVNNPSFGQEEGGNWADQVEQEEQGEEKPQKSDGEEKKEGGEDEAVPDADGEEEVAPTEMTLDEWRAMQSTAAKKKQFNIRKPGEGEDSAKWSNMQVIHESTINKPVQHVLSEDKPRSNQAKPTIDVNIRFDMPPRSGGRGGRGGRGFRGGGGGRGGFRGGQRGGGGRYGNRYGNQHPPPPDVLNEKEFPTLPAA